MKNLLLSLLLIVISITAFSQKRFEFSSKDYHIGGMLITENETPMFLKNLNYIKLRYEELITASKSFSVEEIFQLVEVKPNKIRGYFLGDREYMYQIFLIPFYDFEVVRVDGVLQRNLVMTLKPTEPSVINLMGFTHTFKNVNEITQFINVLEMYSDKDWEFQKYLDDNYIQIVQRLNGLNTLTPYYGHTILRDAPKGDKITKVKISIFKKTKPVILLNEGIRYAFDEYLKVYYNGKIGWVSIKSFNPQDVYAIRKDIVWMDNENVNF